MSIEKSETDAAILALKSQGLSFREISNRLGKSLGAVTGRYYRLKGVRPPSQIARDAQLKRQRGLNRIARNRERSQAAIRAVLELRSGIDFSVAVGKALAAGASMEMIGTCCGVTKQAIYKKLRKENA